MPLVNKNYLFLISVRNQLGGHGCPEILTWTGTGFFLSVDGIRTYFLCILITSSARGGVHAKSALGAILCVSSPTTLQSEPNTAPTPQRFLGESLRGADCIHLLQESCTPVGIRHSYSRGQNTPTFRRGEAENAGDVFT